MFHIHFYIHTLQLPVPGLSSIGSSCGSSAARLAEAGRPGLFSNSSKCKYLGAELESGHICHSREILETKTQNKSK